MGSGESGGRLGSFDEADEEVVISCGDFAPQSDGVLAIGSSDEVERHVLERCEVGRGVVGPQPALYASSTIRCFAPSVQRLRRPVSTTSRRRTPGNTSLIMSSMHAKCADHITQTMRPLSEAYPAICSVTPFPAKPSGPSERQPSPSGTPRPPLQHEIGQTQCFAASLS